jgi:hypothetical protein
MDFRKQIEDVKRVGKHARGRGEYLAFLAGKKLTRNAAIMAHCYECQAFYRDGVNDCASRMCPLYQYHHYRPGPGDSGLAAGGDAA